jgi:hypothetical protein
MDTKHSNVRSASVPTADNRADELFELRRTLAGMVLVGVRSENAVQALREELLELCQRTDRVSHALEAVLPDEVLASLFFAARTGTAQARRSILELTIGSPAIDTLTLARHALFGALTLLSETAVVNGYLPRRELAGAEDSLVSTRAVLGAAAHARGNDDAWYLEVARAEIALASFNPRGRVCPETRSMLNSLLTGIRQRTPGMPARIAVFFTEQTDLPAPRVGRP